MTDIATPSTESKTTATPSTVTSTTTVKPAWRTTEAWFNFATGLVGALTSAGIIGPDSQFAKIAGMVLMLLAAGLHTWSRTSVKNAAVNA